MKTTLKPNARIPDTIETRIAQGETFLVSKRPEDQRFVAGLYGRFGTGHTSNGATVSEAIVNLEMVLWGEAQ